MVDEVMLKFILQVSWTDWTDLLASKFTIKSVLSVLISFLDHQLLMYTVFVSLCKIKWHQDGVNSKNLHNKQQKSCKEMIVNFPLNWCFFSCWIWHRSGTGFYYQDVNKLNLLKMCLPKGAGQKSS